MWEKTCLSGQIPRQEAFACPPGSTSVLPMDAVCPTGKLLGAVRIVRFRLRVVHA